MRSIGRARRTSQTGPLTRAPKRRRLASRQDVDALITSLALPRALHERLLLAAVRLNWSLAEVLRAAAAEWLDRHEAPPRGGPRR